MSPVALLTMDSWEWAGWLAYSALEPFGPLREDFRAGQVAATAANVWGSRVKPEDFFASLKESRPPARANHPGGFLSLCPALTPIECR